MRRNRIFHFAQGLLGRRGRESSGNLGADRRGGAQDSSEMVSGGPLFATSGRIPSGLRLAADPQGIGNRGCGVHPTLGVIRAVRSS